MILTCLGLTCLGQCRFRPTCRRRVGPKGGGLEGWGLEGWAEGWGPAGCGPRFFSLFRHNFLSFFSLLGVFSWNFGGVFEGQDGAQSRTGFHTTAREPKRGHFRAPALQTPPKFHERIPTREKKERKLWRAREKKERNFGRSGGGGFGGGGSGGGGSGGGGPGERPNLGHTPPTHHTTQHTTQHNTTTTTTTTTQHNTQNRSG